MIGIKSPLIGVGLSEAVARSCSWLSLALLPFFISPSDYGKIVLCYSLLMTLSPLVLMGQDRELLSAKTENIALEAFSAATVCMITSAILFLLGAGSIPFIPEAPLYLLYIPLVALLLSLNKILLCTYRTQSKFLQFSKNRLLYASTRLILVVTLSSYTGSTFLYLLAESFAAVFTSLKVFSVASWSKISFYTLRIRISKGLPIACHGISGILLSMSDRFILAHYLDSDAVGQYSFMYTFTSALTFAYAVIAIVFEPKIYKSNSILELSKTTTKCVIYMISLGCVLSVILSVCYFIATIYLEEYTYNPLIYCVLLAAHLIMPFYLVSNYTLIKIGRAKLLFFSSLIAMILNVALNVFLIPKYGITGAAYSTLAGNLALVVVVQTMRHKNIYKFSWT
ncbi:polysaccharide biosynthesis C-terminal domain-containing protein [Allopusillimonas ginsengisoli]|uniref:polysaccharide biosynthesis C-terminal domain-containing protein n=1 Tax=Allopusillimonas ginsengisoli TaxID=453575 RepID=UPI00101EF356|nr:polysaccharide biosynthesis C-terminal domain-containing protein [Allopusillimonas ginsengisoli]TEA79947.1 hypothetical protein ERE07_03160 [Allopusillimonas ginsengisoli]